MRLIARVPMSLKRPGLASVLFLFLAGCATWRTGTLTPQELPPGLLINSAEQQPRLRMEMLGSLGHGPHHIVAGDVLDLTVPDLYEENKPVTVPLRVAADGTVRLPLAGPVRVASLTLSDSEQVIGRTFVTQAVLKRGDVVVALHQPGKVRVNVLGAVTHPGQYDLNPGETDLLSALLTAGGVTQEAGSHLEIRHSLPEPDNSRPHAKITGLLVGRPATEPASRTRLPEVEPAGRPKEPREVRFVLTSNRDRQTLSRGVPLRSGDTVYVEERKLSPIYVVGLVNKPGEFRFPPDGHLRVLEAIGLAGGVDRTSLPTKVVIVRKKPDQSGMVAIRVDLDDAKRDLQQNICLMPGDTVSVEETVQSYMRGLLRGAFRIGVGADFSAVPMLP